MKSTNQILESSTKKLAEMFKNRKELLQDNKADKSVDIKQKYKQCNFEAICKIRSSSDTSPPSDLYAINEDETVFSLKDPNSNISKRLTATFSNVGSQSNVSVSSCKYKMDFVSDETSSLEFIRKVVQSKIDFGFNQKISTCFMSFGLSQSGCSGVLVGDSDNPGMIPVCLADSFHNLYIKGNNLKLVFLLIINNELYDASKEKLVKLECKDTKINPMKLNCSFEINDYDLLNQYFNNLIGNIQVAKKMLYQCHSFIHLLVSIAIPNTDKSITFIDMAGIQKSNTNVLSTDNIIDEQSKCFIQCIEALYKNTNSDTKVVVPTDNSYITRILRNYLYPHKKVVLITCVDPAVKNYIDNKVILDYASKFRTMNHQNSWILDTRNNNNTNNNSITFSKDNQGNDDYDMYSLEVGSEVSEDKDKIFLSNQKDVEDYNLYYNKKKEAISKTYKKIFEYETNPFNNTNKNNIDNNIFNNPQKRLSVNSCTNPAENNNPSALQTLINNNNKNSLLPNKDSNIITNHSNTKSFKSININNFSLLDNGINTSLNLDLLSHRHKSQTTNMAIISTTEHKNFDDSTSFNLLPKDSQNNDSHNNNKDSILDSYLKPSVKPTVTNTINNNTNNNNNNDNEIVEKTESKKSINKVEEINILKDNVQYKDIIINNNNNNKKQISQKAVDIYNKEEKNISPSKKFVDINIKKESQLEIKSESYSSEKDIDNIKANEVNSEPILYNITVTNPEDKTYSVDQYNKLQETIINNENNNNNIDNNKSIEINVHKSDIELPKDIGKISKKKNEILEKEISNNNNNSNIKKEELYTEKKDSFKYSPQIRKKELYMDNMESIEIPGIEKEIKLKTKKIRFSIKQKTKSKKYKIKNISQEYIDSEKWNDIIQIEESTCFSIITNEEKSTKKSKKDKKKKDEESSKKESKRTKKTKKRKAKVIEQEISDEAEKEEDDLNYNKSKKKQSKRSKSKNKDSDQEDENNSNIKEVKTKGKKRTKKYKK